LPALGRGPKSLRKLVRALFLGRERGSTAVEAVLGVAILGLLGATFLGAVATETKVTAASSESAIAESLVRSELEYVKMYAYQPDASEYPVDPSLTIPAGWTLPNPTVEPVHATDDGLQKVTATAVHQGRTIISVVMYKMNR